MKEIYHWLTGFNALGLTILRFTRPAIARNYSILLFGKISK